MRVCEFLETTRKGPVLIGTITYDGVGLRPQSHDPGMMQRILNTPNKGGKSTENPAKWFDALPSQYSGTYLRAKILDQTKIAKEYDEAKHPRDEKGRWTAGEGSSAEEAVQRAADASFTEKGDEATPGSVQMLEALRREQEKAQPLTPEESEALRRYIGIGTGGAGEEFNVIADPTHLNDVLRGRERGTKEDKEQIKAMDSLVSRTVPRDMVVYRGADFRTRDDEPKKMNFPVGGTFKDKGFVSTSPDIGVGFRFAAIETSGGEITKGSTLFRIEVPKGSQGFAIGQTEREFLMPRGTTFRITGVERVQIRSGPYSSEPPLTVVHAKVEK